MAKKIVKLSGKPISTEQIAKRFKISAKVQSRISELVNGLELNSSKDESLSPKRSPTSKSRRKQLLDQSARKRTIGITKKGTVLKAKSSAGAKATRKIAR